MRPKASEVRKSLVEQLRGAGRDTAYYLDMVESYMDLYAMREEFRKDVKKKGHYITEKDKYDTEYTKLNPSISAMERIVGKMAGLLSKMGLDSPTPDDDEEL